MDFRISFVLTEDFSQRELCPVTQLFALAIADNALQDIQTGNDLANLPIPESRETAQVFTKPEMDNVPIFRNLDTSYSNVSATNILSADSMSRYLIDLGERAGHTQRLSGYAFCRGHGNILDRG